MNCRPIKLERSSEDTILIEWSDGRKREYSAKELRKNCPCALCKEIHGPKPQEPADPLSLPILTKAETLPLRIQSMHPVGLYAYKIQFSDGHDLGIFTFDILQSIGQEVSSPDPQ